MPLDDQWGDLPFQRTALSPEQRLTPSCRLCTECLHNGSQTSILGLFYCLGMVFRWTLCTTAKMSCLQHDENRLLQLTRRNRDYSWDEEMAGGCAQLATLRAEPNHWPQVVQRPALSPACLALKCWAHSFPISPFLPSLTEACSLSLLNSIIILLLYTRQTTSKGNAHCAPVVTSTTCWHRFE